MEILGKKVEKELILSICKVLDVDSDELSVSTIERLDLVKIMSDFCHAVSSAPY